MKIATAWLEIKAKDAGARAEAKKVADDVGKVKPDKIPIDADPKRANAEVKGFGANAKKVAQEVRNQFLRLFTATLFVNEIRKAIGAASDLEQAVGGTRAVFKEASGVIDDYAKQAADRLGLSEAAFRQYTTLLGGSLKRMGFDLEAAADRSIWLTEVAADLAATYGGTTVEAVEALSAAFRGEADPAERFNLNLKQGAVAAKAVEMGLAESTSKVNEYARAQALMALIAEQSADAQGQFARESDTAAGRAQIFTANLENLRAKIGTQLLPVFTRAVAFLSEVVTIFGRLPGPVQTAVVAMIGFAALSGPFTRLASTMRLLATAIRTVTAAAAKNPWIALATAVTAAGVALWGFLRRTDSTTEALKKAREAASGLSEEISSLGAIEALTANITKFVRENDTFRAALNASGLTINDLVQAVAAGDTGLVGFRRQIIEGGRAAGLTTDQIQDLADTLYEDLVLVAGETVKIVGEMEVAQGRATNAAEGWKRAVAASGKAAAEAGDATADATGAVDEFGNALDEVGRSAGSTKPHIDGVQASTDRVSDEAERAADQLEAFADEADELNDAAKDLADTLDDLFGSEIALQEAADRVEDAFEDLTKSVNDNGKALDNNTGKGRANRDAIREAAENVIRYTTQLARSGASSTEVSAKYEEMRRRLISQMQQFGLTEREAEKYVNQLGLTPRRVDTAIRLHNVETARRMVQEHIKQIGAIPPSKLSTIRAAVNSGDVAAVERALEHLRRTREATIRVRVSGGGGSSAPRAMAEGGFFPGGSTAGTLFRLAEKPGRRGDEVVLPLGNERRMRELLSLPSVKGRVAAAMDAGAGGGQAVVVPVQTGPLVSVGTLVTQRPTDVRREMERLAWEARVKQQSTGGPR